MRITNLRLAREDRLEFLHGFEAVIWVEDGAVQMQGPV